MKNLVTSLWQDECGMIISAELVLVGTLGVLGMIAGLSHVRGAVVEEYKDLGDSLRSLNQSYSYSGFCSRKAFTAGSAFMEDCQEPVIHFETIYEGCETSCETPCANVCPPTGEVIIEQDCCPTEGSREELLVPTPIRERVPNAKPKSIETELSDRVEDFVPAPKYSRAEYQTPPLGYEHPESIYNVRRYSDSPYRPIAPYLTLRSPVW